MEKHQHSIIWIGCSGAHKRYSYYGCESCGFIQRVRTKDKNWERSPIQDITKVLKLCWGKQCNRKILRTLLLHRNEHYVIDHLKIMMRTMITEPEARIAPEIKKDVIIPF